MPLIASPRHTAEDLRAWERAQAGDFAHAQTAVMRRRFADAMQALESFAARGAPYVSVSWGKDSIVAAHLAWCLAEQGGPRLPLAWVHRTPYENPDCVRVRDAFLGRWRMPYEEIRIDCELGEDGKWYVIGDRSARPKQLGFARLREMLGDRYVSGVRAEESAGRKIRMRHHGAETVNTCAPLGWWSAADVYAHLALHDLPVHPAYAMTMGGRLERRRLRVGSIGGSQGREWGRREWERTYYPEVAELSDR